jgi:tRNA pseudouridine55 synthase
LLTGIQLLSNNKKMNGIFGVVKPKGCTSAAVVARIKKALQAKGTRLKVGHGGTLDPLATGVLVIGVGHGTKLLHQCLSGTKVYRAAAIFGNETDTQDSTGSSTAQKSCSHVTERMIEAVLSEFTGDIMQTPPMYSAIRKNGKRLYELARAGIQIEVPARKVRVHKISLDMSSSRLPEFGLIVECGGGTYIRTLIQDIARALQTCAHMTCLKRTASTSQGSRFEIENCLSAIDDKAEILAHMERAEQLGLNFPSADEREDSKVKCSTKRPRSREHGSAGRATKRPTVRSTHDGTSVKNRHAHNTTITATSAGAACSTKWDPPDQHWGDDGAGSIDMPRRKKDSDGVAQRCGAIIVQLPKLKPQMVRPPGARLATCRSTIHPSLRCALSPRPVFLANSRCEV